ncbi:DNA repair protein endonuclease SAE2/CtIP C-terminus-domain-containing protein [Parachaetomium inaequale]|uniref:DNA repair protein endonuclease SAE2/CtIP C-terminus-domain-containing protein n=1 Tax=Parachaetomium inaequale TaxID=2588326 RepID=A0AAN6PAN1_9PEZI|nr:DNA repair protein endonuclease SAE2/CtIP C-terminus-domain-containing protein [Parachaetomium inaequale]
MDYWPSKGRPMLLAALEAACDSVEEGLAAEIQKRDEARHATLLEEVSRLQAAATRVDELEKENHALLRDLDRLRGKQGSQDAGSPESPAVTPPAPQVVPLPTARPALAEISSNAKISAVSAGPSACGSEDVPNWEKEYSKLALRHTALEQRHEETQRSARKIRESRDNWTKYAQSLEGKIEKLEKKVQRYKNTDGRLPVPSSAKSRPTEADPDDALPEQTALGSKAVSDPAPATSPRTHEDVVNESVGRENAIPAPTAATPGYAGRSADEETQDGSDGVDELPPIPSGMAGKSAVTIKEEPSSDAPVVVSERPVRKRKHTDDDVGMPAPPRRIKSEQSTSSEPVITGEAPIFCPHESIDLDEEERGMPTPRKQRDWEHRHILREDREDDAPIEQRFAGARAAQRQVNTPTRGLAPDRPTASGLSTHKLSRTHRDHASPIRAGWTMRSGIADVAEETVESFYSPKPRQAGNGLHQTPAQGRLHSLLNDGSPKKTAAFLSPARLRRDNADLRFDKENIENVAPEEGHDVLVKPSPAVKASTATPLRRHNQDKGNPSKPGRLRDRPLAGLRPEDFKVNARSNNGYGYAFDEVVRNREERAELAGCTDPNCCGRQFRAMAESELGAGGPGILSRVADIKMMESYLGAEAYRLVEMTREERQETWLKAKIQDLADRYGRHRHRFARRPSPPGYWNPDFPSTQEIEKSKEEAERVERGLVEERWREAMRGGRWLFRDE